MSFLPKNYEVPQGKSNYMKLESGQNKFRIVSDSIVGFEYWNTNNKPVRTKTNPTEKPADVRLNDDGSYTVKHFWAFAVINRWNNQIQVLELTQASIMRSLTSLIENADWGDPKGYDISIDRQGQKLDTKYTVQPSPHKPLTKEEQKMVDETPVNLEALFSGGDPFNSEKIASLPEEKEVTADMVPF